MIDLGRYLAPPEKKDAGEKLLTISETADLLGVSVRSIHNYLKAGTLAHLRWGRTVRIPASALKAIPARPRDGAADDYRKVKEL